MMVVNAFRKRDVSTRQPASFMKHALVISIYFCHNMYLFVLLFIFVYASTF